MKKIITSIALFIFAISSAQQFEEGMGRAFQMWKEGKSSEASDMFERIATAEKKSWLPNYYVALTNTTTAFTTKEKEKIDALLAKAQAALDIEILKDSNNPELIIMQAMINSAWIVYDPMVYGMKLSGKNMELYAKAEALAPKNPRVVFSKVEFQIGGAKFTGIDTKPLCAQIEKSILLFSTYKTDLPFAPSWGLDRAVEALKNCK